MHQRVPFTWSKLECLRLYFCAWIAFWMILNAKMSIWALNCLTPFHLVHINCFAVSQSPCEMHVATDIFRSTSLVGYLYWYQKSNGAAHCVIWLDVIFGLRAIHLEIAEVKVIHHSFITWIVCNVTSNAILFKMYVALLVNDPKIIESINVLESLFFFHFQLD